MDSRDLGAMLGSVASGNTTGSFTTGGFSFDEDTMRGLVNEWLSLGDDYDRSYRDTTPLTQVKGPGLDYASKAQAEAANASGDAYRKYLLHNRDYCYNQAQLCQNALDDYLGVEHHNVRDISESGQPLDDGPQSGI